jgi:hypothetical protein
MLIQAEWPLLPAHAGTTSPEEDARHPGLLADRPHYQPLVPSAPVRSLTQKNGNDRCDASSGCVTSVRGAEVSGRAAGV